uniref:DNA-dependent metalloprotease SPRTN n=1 Tax=Latimeria chalumnae TaxID=7897 RepID=H3B9W6_LATCH
MEDGDFLLALQLQQQFDQEGGLGVATGKPLSIVDEAWEFLDPNPDVRALFLEFNSVFFWGKLAGVEVRWSPRMTLCAGLCCYEGRGGLCSIRLSEPLLKLRPRKDLVETLLHEMIHAFLFVTNNNKDHDSHGAEFCKHMSRINKTTGANITIYHTFHDEVEEYRQHWWRCNGPCQNRKPFFGYVKRAMNRPPSARDPWWAHHQQTCGGTYTKIKEPENYKKKGKKEEVPSQMKSIGSHDKKDPIHGVDIRTIIPFSGKGFVLGGNEGRCSPGKSINPSGSSKESSVVEVTQPVPKTSVTCEQDLSFADRSFPRTSSMYSPLPKSSSSFTSNSNFLPKKSVGNNKVFKNINGSPIKVSFKLNSSVETSGSQKKVNQYLTPLGVTKKRVSSDLESSQQHTFVSVQSTSSKRIDHKKKKMRTEETPRPILDFFTKRSPQGEQRDTINNYAKSKANQEATIPFQQDRDLGDLHVTVICPACQSAVLESAINVHLDSCL